jgi:hypothetical protein
VNKKKKLAEHLLGSAAVLKMYMLQHANAGRSELPEDGM